MDRADEKEMIAEFFAIFPDYELCRASASNVISGTTTHEKIRELLWKKTEGAALNREAISERLNSKKIRVGEEWRLLKEMSTRDIIRLPDDALREVLQFYFKHPYAHGRVRRGALLPRFFRTLFFRQLIGQAMLRKLDVDIDGMFDLMGML